MGKKRVDFGLLALLTALFSCVLAIAGWLRINRLKRQVVLLFRGLRISGGKNANQTDS